MLRNILDSETPEGESVPYYIYDGASAEGRKRMHASDDKPPHLTFDLGGSWKFHNTDFLKMATDRYHGEMVLLHGLAHGRDLRKIEERLKRKTLTAGAFLTIREYSEEETHWAIDATTQVHNYTLWSVGFFPKSRLLNVIELFATHKMGDPWGIGFAGLFDYLYIRNFDTQVLSIMCFHEEHFESIKELISQELNPGEPEIRMWGSPEE